MAGVRQPLDPDPTDDGPNEADRPVDLNPQAVVRVLFGIVTVLVLAVTAAVICLLDTRNSIDVATVRRLSSWERTVNSKWTLSVFLHEQEVDSDRQVRNDCCAAALFSSAQSRRLMLATA